MLHILRNQLICVSLVATGWGPFASSMVQRCGSPRSVATGPDEGISKDVERPFDPSHSIPELGAVLGRLPKLRTEGAGLDLDEAGEGDGSHDDGNADWNGDRHELVLHGFSSV